MGQRQFEAMTEYQERLEQLKKLEEAAQSRGESGESGPEQPLSAFSHDVVPDVVPGAAAEAPSLNPRRVVTVTERNHEYDETQRCTTPRSGRSS